MHKGKKEKAKKKKKEKKKEKKEEKDKEKKNKKKKKKKKKKEKKKKKKKKKQQEEEKEQRKKNYFYYVLLLFQMVEWEANTFSLRIKGWLSDHWNKLDIVAVLCFAVGNFLRISPHPLFMEAARDVLAFDLFIFYFRFLEYLTFVKTIGPKVIMIGKMV